MPPVLVLLPFVSMMLVPLVLMPSALVPLVSMPWMSMIPPPVHFLLVPLAKPVGVPLSQLYCPFSICFSCHLYDFSCPSYPFPFRIVEFDPCVQHSRKESSLYIKAPKCKKRPLNDMFKSLFHLGKGSMTILSNVKCSVSIVICPPYLSHIRSILVSPNP